MYRLGIIAQALIWSVKDWIVNVSVVLYLRWKER